MFPPWDAGGAALPGWGLSWLGPDKSGILGPRPTQYLFGQPRAYLYMAANGTKMHATWIHQLCPQLKIRKHLKPVKCSFWRELLTVVIVQQILVIEPGLCCLQFFLYHLSYLLL